MFIVKALCILTDMKSDIINEIINTNNKILNVLQSISVNKY